MNVNFEVPQSVLNQAIEESLFKGELGDKVADRLANLYAEITTYNRTDAAKLLNIGRSTLHEYEKDGKIKFRPDGRITLASLLEFGRSFAAPPEDSDDDESVTRKSKREKKRSF